MSNVSVNEGAVPATASISLTLLHACIDGAGVMVGPCLITYVHLGSLALSREREKEANLRDSIAPVRWKWLLPLCVLCVLCVPAVDVSHERVCLPYFCDEWCVVLCTFGSSNSAEHTHTHTYSHIHCYMYIHTQAREARPTPSTTDAIPSRTEQASSPPRSRAKTFGSGRQTAASSSSSSSGPRTLRDYQQLSARSQRSKAKSPDEDDEGGMFTSSHMTVT